MVNLYGRVIGMPEHWYEFDPYNSTIMVYDIKNRTGIDFNLFYDLANRLVNTKNITDIDILDPYYQYSHYFDSKVLLPFEINQTTVKIIF